MMKLFRYLVFPFATVGLIFAWYLTMLDVQSASPHVFVGLRGHGGVTGGYLTIPFSILLTLFWAAYVRQHFFFKKEKNNALNK